MVSICGLVGGKNAGGNCAFCALAVGGLIWLSSNPAILSRLTGVGGPSAIGDQTACIELVSNFATALRKAPPKSGETDVEAIISTAMTDCNEGRFGNALNTVARYMTPG
jgi:hypothetical protein